LSIIVGFIVLSTKLCSTRYGSRLSISEETSKTLGPPAEILDHITLGSSFDVSDLETLKRLNIGYVLNVAEEFEHPNPPKHVQFLNLKFQDVVVPGTVQFDIFEEAFKFMDLALLDSNITKKKVFVHCMRGRSRSATVIIAYLMSRKNMNLREAYLIVKEKRPAIGPHYFMKRQLVDYEIQTIGSSSIVLSDQWSLDIKTRVDRTPSQATLENTQLLQMEAELENGPASPSERNGLVEKLYNKNPNPPVHY